MREDLWIAESGNHYLLDRKGTDVGFLRDVSKGKGKVVPVNQIHTPSCFSSFTSCFKGLGALDFWTICIGLVVLRFWYHLWLQPLSESVTIPRPYSTPGNSLLPRGYKVVSTINHILPARQKCMKPS